MRWLSFSLVLAAVACGRPAAAPPPPGMLRTVAVLPANNRTGDPLLVSGTSFLEKYATRSARVTVPDVLTAEARLQLERRGFTVVPPEVVEAATGGRTPGSAEAAAALTAGAKLEGLALYLDIRRWEADAPTHPAFIIAGVAASLVDPATRRVVWSAERRASPAATPGEITLGSAYVTAARAVVAELLSPLGPEVSPPS